MGVKFSFPPLKGILVVSRNLISCPAVFLSRRFHPDNKKKRKKKEQKTSRERAVSRNHESKPLGSFLNGRLVQHACALSVTDSTGEARGALSDQRYPATWIDPSSGEEGNRAAAHATALFWTKNTQRQHAQNHRSHQHQHASRCVHERIIHQNISTHHVHQHIDTWKHTVKQNNSVSPTTAASSSGTPEDSWPLPLCAGLDSHSKDCHARARRWLVSRVVPPPVAVPLENRRHRCNDTMQENKENRSTIRVESKVVKRHYCLFCVWTRREHNEDARIEPPTLLSLRSNTMAAITP